MEKRKTRWGLISTANINRKLIPAIRATDSAELVAVASRDEGRAKEYAATWEIPKAFGSYEAMFADPDIDCVYNPLPNSMHGEWSIKAMRAGKHVLSEKPFAIDSDEAVEMAQVALETNRLLMEAFMFRFHPQMQRLRAMIVDGEIGEVVLMQAAFGFRLEDYDNVRLIKELAGGSVMDLGTYPIAFMRFVMGAEPSHAFAVARFGPKSGVDELMMGTLSFPDGVHGQFDCSFGGGYHTFARVVGSEGSIEVPYPFTPKEGQAGLLLKAADGSVIEEIDLPDSDPYQLEVEHFCSAVLDGTPLRWTPNDAIKQMRVIDALYRSARSGSIVEVSEPVLEYQI